MCDDKLVFPVWVNVYNCGQNWGGSEEGGWWYTSGSVEESHKVFTQEELEATQALLNARYELTSEGRYLYEDQYDHPLFDRDRNSPYSATGTGFWFSIRIQDHAAKNFPEERPHYE